MPGRSKPGRSKPAKRPASGASAPSTPFQHLSELLRWVDLIVEVLDARLPVSTRHPKADQIFGSKPRLLIFTKEDLADRATTKALVDSVQAETGYPCLLLTLKNTAARGDVIASCIEATKPRLDALMRKGLLPRPMRICVVGLPNVGKSSLINWLIGQKRARVGNTPGITKGTQWVRVHPKLELLDTPGILPPVAFSREQTLKLATCNLVPLNNYDALEAAEFALAACQSKYPKDIERYIRGLSSPDRGLVDIALARNLLTSGAKPDVNRAAALFLSELRDGKVGRFTFDP